MQAVLEPTLLERLRGRSAPGEAAGRARLLGRLETLLNDRSAWSPAIPDQGTPAPADVRGGADGRERLRQAIAASILAFDPRLRGVRVEAAERDGAWRIHLGLGVCLNASGEDGALRLREAPR